MKTISLKEVKEIKLMNRIDKKYIINFDQFCSLTNYISNNFYILSENDNTLFKYHSIYFDTPNMDMQKDHINKTKHRQKIRIREYCTGEKYLEIKEKNNSEFTKKKRIPVTSYSLDGEQQWIDENLIYDTKNLNKKLDIVFNRMTLVSLDKKERVTIDFGIKFYNYITKKKEIIKDIIVEVKKLTEEKTNFELVLNILGIQEKGFSKYNIGLQKTS